MVAPKRLAPFAALALVVAASAPVSAEEPKKPDSPAPPAGSQSAWDDVPRPWLYTQDPTAPPQFHVMASIGVSYAQVDRGAARPFAADRAHAGAVATAGAEVGLHRFVSIHAEGLISGQGSGDSVSGGTLVGATFFPLRASSRVDVAISGGYLRELGGANGAWGRATVAVDAGPARMMLSTVVSHIFAPGRDPVDLLVSTGVSFKLHPIFRLGAEYVIQDLEGLWEKEEEEDGGIRHFLGATASLDLGRRVRIVAGPSVGLTRESPRVMGKVMAYYMF